MVGQRTLTPPVAGWFYNPAGLDLAALREVVEAVRYDGLSLPKVEREEEE